MRGVVSRWRTCSGAATVRTGRAAVVPRAYSTAGSTLQQSHSAPPSSQLAGSCLYVLDLLPLIYRFLPREESAAPVPAPEPTSASQPQQQVGEGPAERFLTSLLTLVRRDVEPPTHMAIAVDVPGATFRHRLYPQYKAHRDQHPPALTEAVCQVLALADALCIPVLAVPGVEADDVVGTLATKAQQDGFGSVVIMSSDKDYYQLLSPTVSVLHGGTYGRLYTLEQFMADEELADPRLWIDVKALMGDSSDNIPGLKGVGPKTARQLVQAFGSVDQITQRLAVMPEAEQKQVVKLNKTQRAVLLSEEGRLAAAFMKELVTINTHLKSPPCQQPWSVYELKVPADGGKRAREWAEKLQMNTLRYFLDKYLDKLADSA